jgi:hypothetical protein
MTKVRYLLMSNLCCCMLPHSCRCFHAHAVPCTLLLCPEVYTAAVCSLQFTVKNHLSPPLLLLLLLLWPAAKKALAKHRFAIVFNGYPAKLMYSALDKDRVYGPFSLKFQIIIKVNQDAACSRSGIHVLLGNQRTDCCRAGWVHGSVACTQQQFLHLWVLSHTVVATGD